MSHLFISYSRHDIAFVRHLKRLIEAEGLRVWMDETGLRPSERWWKRILTNIDVSAGVIVVMSATARESQWVDREVLYAEREGKPIFPVLLTGEVWPLLANIQYADLRAGEAAVLPAAFSESLRRVVAESRAAHADLTFAAASDDVSGVKGAELDTDPVVNPRPLNTSNAPTILGRPAELDRLIQELETKEHVVEPGPVYAEAPTIPERHRMRRRRPIEWLVLVLSVIVLLAVLESVRQIIDDDGATTPVPLAGAQATVDGATSPSAGATTSPAPTPTARIATDGPALSASATTTLGPTTPAAFSAASDPDLRLVYDDMSFVVVNVSGRTLDISKLVFDRYTLDGTRSYWEARGFDSVATHVPTTAMEADGCFQLQTTSGPIAQPPESLCPRLLGFFRTGVEGYYFWLADDETDGTVFTVSFMSEDVVLATCTLEAGECEVYLDE